LAHSLPAFLESGKHAQKQKMPKFSMVCPTPSPYLHITATINNNNDMPNNASVT